MNHSHLTENSAQAPAISELDININQGRAAPPSSDNFAQSMALSASILISAILLSATLFYNFKLVLKKMDVLASPAKSGDLAQAGQAALPAPNNPPPQVAPPAGPVNVPQRADAPVLGNKNAKVSVEEFSDFQCPFCQRFFKDTFGQIKSKYIDTGKVKFVFRHYPLPFHQNAQKAAEAGECASRQGKFWPYHDVLFAKGQADGAGLAVADLKKYAADLGLNAAQFNSCLDGGQTAEIVKKDTADGSASGVSGTPTVFINGKKIVGAQPTANFEQAIEEALKQ